jgi:hypothetical protein
MKLSVSLFALAAASIAPLGVALETIKAVGQKGLRGLGVDSLEDGSLTQGRGLEAIAGDLGGVTLPPGTYESLGAVGITGILKLDNADAGGVWTFTIGGALTTGALAGVEMLFDDSVDNPSAVAWDVAGAITLGAGSTVIGDMTAAGAITLGAKASTTGTLSSSTDAAIVLGAGASAIGLLPSDLGGVTLPPGEYESAGAVGITGTLILDNPADGGGIWTFKIGGAMTTGALAAVAFSHDPADTSTTVSWDVAGAISIGAGSNVIGDMTAAGAITLGAGASTTGTLSSSTDAAVLLGAGASADGRLPSDLGGVTLPPGTYKSEGAVGSTGTLILDNTPHDDDDGINSWDFTIGGAFTTAALSKVTMLYPDEPFSVTWHVDGAITLGASSTVVGNMTAVGAITLGADASTGTLESTTDAAITLGAHASAVGRLPPDLGGVTLVPGTYESLGAVGVTGTFILDNRHGGGVWTFKIGGALTTGALAAVVFHHDPGGNTNTVKWDVAGAITLGAGSTVIGDMTAAGGITLGAGASTTGTLSSSTDAAIIDPNK